MRRYVGYAWCGDSSGDLVVRPVSLLLFSADCAAVRAAFVMIEFEFLTLLIQQSAGDDGASTWPCGGACGAGALVLESRLVVANNILFAFSSLIFAKYERSHSQNPSWLHSISVSFSFSLVYFAFRLL